MNTLNSKLQGFFLLGLMGLMAMFTPAQAAVDADITTAITDATTVFTSVSALILTVVVFFIARRFLKRIG